MRRVFRRALVLTIMFALVASAAAWRQCAALQLAAATAANVAHGKNAPNHHANAAPHGEHVHHAKHHHKTADDPAAPPADDHGCMKCCTMCGVANAVLPAANAAVTFNVSTPTFFQRHETRAGKTLAVDPGIPKRIV